MTLRGQQGPKRVLSCGCNIFKIIWSSSEALRSGGLHSGQAVEAKWDITGDAEGDYMSWELCQVLAVEMN